MQRLTARVSVAPPVRRSPPNGTLLRGVGAEIYSPTCRRGQITIHATVLFAGADVNW
ncbi:MAG: hypothetical protein ACLRXB_06045 [Escherichia coli]